MKAISLFSGVGGFDLGLERAGIETVLQAEIDPWCNKVLARHWPNTRRVEDVRCVHNSRDRQDGASGVTNGHRRGREDEGAGFAREQFDYGGIDLVYGGFPCQDLSVAGKRAGLGGERSGLWFEFHRVLSELRPRYALVENVPGLLSSGDSADFRIILEGLGELGYGVAWRVWDAQFFLVPQRRRRVFILAVLDSEPRLGAERAAQVLSLCESCGGNPPASRTAGERTPGSVAIRTANTGANGHGVADDVAHTLDGANGQAVLAATVRGRSSGEGVNMPGRGGEDDQNLVVANLLGAHHGRQDLDNDTYVTAPTLTAGDLNPKWTGNNGGVDLLMGTLTARMMNALGARDIEEGAIQNFPQGVRRLTPLECERLQGWPDDWTRWAADGSEIPDSHRYRLIGNGVASPVAEWIGHRLAAIEKARLAAGLARGAA